MKKLLIAITALIIITSCEKKTPQNPEQYKAKEYPDRISKPKLDTAIKFSGFRTSRK